MTTEPLPLASGRKEMKVEARLARAVAETAAAAARRALLTQRR